MSFGAGASPRVIQFVLVAVVVYFALIVPMNYVKTCGARRRAGGRPAETPRPRSSCSSQIRDLAPRRGATASWLACTIRDLLDGGLTSAERT